MQFGRNKPPLIHIRFLTNDGSAVPETQRLTAAQKNAHVDLLLSQMANCCPVTGRNALVKPQSHACWQYHTETQPGPDAIPSSPASSAKLPDTHIPLTA